IHGVRTASSCQGVQNTYARQKVARRPQEHCRQQQHNPYGVSHLTARELLPLAPHRDAARRRYGRALSAQLIAIIALVSVSLTLVLVLILSSPTVVLVIGALAVRRRTRSPWNGLVSGRSGRHSGE